MTNRLIHEQSPYLLQHAHNPVDWYPWGEEPFERAKNEHKPVIVSIGYAACHWCHVMERESFESEEVAAFMNEHFINIKVDREEHPDVDHLYMDAVQGITGSGGWPLNVFVTPERIPFYGGTYFPPTPAYGRLSWMQLLQRMSDVWTQQQEEVVKQTDQMLGYLRQAAQTLPGKAPVNEKLDMNVCASIAATLLKQADMQFGGFGSAPKFPGTMSISFLLEHFYFTKHEPALQHALFSLDAMIKGGIYDQIGGGFSRYSTDKFWLAPHFEKMLYDNALLLLSLCDAYQLTNQPLYKKIIEQTIAFIDRELTHKSGLFFSALDADSEGVEGKFYTWTYEDWKASIDDEIVTKYFGVQEEGNWEETNILHVAIDPGKLASENGISTDEILERIERASQRLFTLRAARIRPITDDKCLLSWNALMNQALTRAGIALNDPALLQKAAHHMDAMLSSFETENGLMHVWKNDKARISANLDDYAYLIQALLLLASANTNPELIKKAATLCELVIEEFSKKHHDFFYYTSSRQSDIPVRKIDLYDGATPAANSVMANNLLELGMCLERTNWIERGVSMLQQMGETVQKHPSSFAHWAVLLQRLAAGPKTVVSSGDEGGIHHSELQKRFLPHCFLLTSEKEISDLPVLKGKNFSGESLIFVCTREACLAPVRSVEDCLRVISAY